MSLNSEKTGEKSVKTVTNPYLKASATTKPRNPKPSYTAYLAAMIQASPDTSRNPTDPAYKGRGGDLGRSGGRGGRGDRKSTHNQQDKNKDTSDPMEIEGEETPPLDGNANNSNTDANKENDSRKSPFQCKV